MAVLPIIPRGPKPDQAAFEAFSCNVPSAGPATPDRLNPDVVVNRDMDVSFKLRMPDGTDVTMWVFTDPNLPSQFPSVPIRVREGLIIHTPTSVKKNTHTIHHHGIEASTFNDGVGHTSFEISGQYTYQWFSSNAGTYLYHCHKNTTLHFEMGMYGLLIIDPPQGPGFVRRVDAVIPYDVEGAWVGDEIDPLWHTFNHNAGLKCPNGEDAGLNLFRPAWFLITGVVAPNTATDPRVAITARAGQTILLRTANAGYTIQRFTLPVDAEVIEIDGRTLGRAPRQQYSAPFVVPANTPFELTTAQRWVMLLRPTAAGNLPAKIEYLHWITRQVLGVANTVINVTP